MASFQVDLYALLGVERTATSAEIRKAYRQKGNGAYRNKLNNSIKVAP